MNSDSGLLPKAVISVGLALACSPGQESSVQPFEVLARVGEEHRPATTEPPLKATIRRAGVQTRNAVAAGEPFEVEVPERATRLAFSLTCQEGADSAACPIASVELRSEFGAWRSLFRGRSGSEWEDHEVPLPEDANRALRFRSEGSDGASKALWGSILLLGRSETRRPNVILVSFDTLAAASLGSFSGHAEVSPRIDGLLAESADFRRAYSQYGNTLVSHSSLFSSLYPRRHGVYGGNDSPRLEASLVGLLAEAGYRTVAFTEGAFVSAYFGFADGFDAYDDGQVRLRVIETGGAADTFANAAEWLEADEGREPFFLFLHTYEVHSPYAPYGESGRRVASDFTPSDSRSFPTERQDLMIRGHNSGRRPLSARDLERLRALHLGEVRDLDTAFGTFLDRLDALGLAENTLLVVMADHGDQFGEWGKTGHGESLHDQVIHVPLAFWWPGVVQPTRSSEPVQLIDVMPTLLDLVDLPVPAGLDGVSLAAAMTGKQPPARPAFAEQRSARGECYQLGLEPNCRLDRLAVIEGRWKLVTSRVPSWTRLYDLEGDPTAEHDVAAEHPEVAARLEALAREYRSVDPSAAKAHSGEIDADTLQRLRALGYSEDSGSAVP